MQYVVRMVLSSTCALLLFLTSANAEGEKYPVDRMLVLALDVSHSVNDPRFALQRRGYAAAFRDAEVIRTITTGPHGAVAVTMAQWGGWGEYVQTVPWMLVRDQADGERFARAILESARVKMESTSISWALLSSERLFETAPYTSERRIIDVSGDGYDETGGLVALQELLERYAGFKDGIRALLERAYRQSGTARVASLGEARAKVCDAGIEVNGLAIEGDEGVIDLDSYYREQVICKKNSFVIRVEDPDSDEEFARAIKRKVRHELGS